METFEDGHPCTVSTPERVIRGKRAAVETIDMALCALCRLQRMTHFVCCFPRAHACKQVPCNLQMLYGVTRRICINKPNSAS
jgi:hypothetical protein